MFLASWFQVMIIRKILKIVQNCFWLIWLSLIALMNLMSTLGTYLENYHILVVLVAIGGALSFLQWLLRKKIKLINNLNIIFSFIWFLLCFAIGFPNLEGLPEDSGMKAYYLLVAFGLFPVLFHMIGYRYLGEGANKR